MLCEVCQQRHATVHITECYPAHRVQRELCEVCAGQKSKKQLTEEQAAAPQEKRKNVQRIHDLLQTRLFEPHRTQFESGQIRSHNVSIWGNWVLLGLSSSVPNLDPMEALFGKAQKGTNHVVQQIEDLEVHVIRWDPERLLSHIFEPFPGAGFRLDYDRRLLFVRAERSLFPDVQKSYAFCNLAAWLLASDEPPDRIEFQFRPWEMRHE